MMGHGCLHRCHKYKHQMEDRATACRTTVVARVATSPAIKTPPKIVVRAIGTEASNKVATLISHRTAMALYNRTKIKASRDRTATRTEVVRRTGTEEAIVVVHQAHKDIRVLMTMDLVVMVD